MLLVTGWVAWALANAALAYLSPWPGVDYAALAELCEPYKALAFFLVFSAMLPSALVGQAYLGGYMARGIMLRELPAAYAIVLLVPVFCFTGSAEGYDALGADRTAGLIAISAIALPHIAINWLHLSKLVGFR